MMTPRPHLRSTITLLLTLLLFIMISREETHATTGDAWWDDDWSYRIPMETNETGSVSYNLNFSHLFIELGLEDAVLDPRSLRVIPYYNGIPGEPVPFTETFTKLFIDGDNLRIGTPPDDMYWAFLEESTSIAIADTPRTQGTGSLHAHLEISESTQSLTGFYYDFNSSSLSDWSNYEVLLYDIYPAANDPAPGEISGLYSFKLEGLKNCYQGYIDGPNITMNNWNEISLPLVPFGICENPNYSSIDKMQFTFLRDNNQFLEIDDLLDLWLDNFRMFDQDADGQIIWNAEDGVDKYYLYFRLLRHGNHQFYFPLVFRQGIN